MRFIDNFYWGAATSSHQVEGGNRNDWSEWEKANAERLAKEAESKFKHLANWDSIKEQAQNPENYISGRACNHYNQFREDFDMAKSLGHNAHRFSIEWSRVEPEEGKFDEKEIEHYREVIRALRERDMEPFLTLWHWTLPVWLAEKGGILNDKFAEYFERYVVKITELLGKDIKFWITVNEPEIFALNSYYRGIWPSQKYGMINFFHATRVIVLAHTRAYRAIKKINSYARVGAAVNISYFESAGDFASIVLKKLADFFWNYRFLRHTHNALDFIGLNYYFHNRIKGLSFNQNENIKTSNLGWEIYPDGLRRALLDLKVFNLPVYITENGVADAKDMLRIDFIKEHITALKRAMQEGVDVRGYFYWSLLDNFEWEKGFWPRFGLAEVDYKTLARKIRPSALVYKKIIEKNFHDF